MQLTRQTFIFPFYHLVSDTDVIHIKHLYRVRTSRQFENDLDFFVSRYGRSDISGSLHNFIKDRRKKTGFIISFDDGLREVYDVAAPILEKKGLQAIIFVNSAFVDNKDLFFRYKAGILIEHLHKNKSTAALNRVKQCAMDHRLPYDNDGKYLLTIGYQNRGLLDEFAVLLDVNFMDYLSQHKPYLSAGQIRSLSDRGFIIGAHSVDHPLFTSINEEEQKTQVIQSIRYVQQQFGSDLRLFSFPFTDHGLPGSFFRELFGTRALADLTFGCAGIKHDTCVRNIQRIPMEVGNFPVQNIVYGEYVYYILKALVNKNIILRH